MTDTGITITLIGIVVTAVFTVVASTIATRQKSLTEMCDRQQSEINDLKGEIHGVKVLVSLQSNYIAVLRGHIYDGKPPPPPPFPEGLTR